MLAALSTGGEIPLTRQISKPKLDWPDRNIDDAFAVRRTHPTWMNPALVINEAPP